MAPMLETAGGIVGWASVALFLLGSALMLYVREVSRSSLIVDTLVRFAPPLAAVDLILLFALPKGGWAPLLIHLILLGLSLNIVVPAVFLARVGKETNGYVIVSRGLLEGIHLKLDDLYGPGPSRMILYGVGRKAGEADTRAALKAHILPPGGMWRWLPYIFRLTGLGRMRITRSRPGESIELVLDDSFEVFHAHPDGASGCDITRGYLAGIGKALHPALDCQAEETRCAQTDGGSRCEFTIRWFEPVKASPPPPLVKA